MRVPALFLILVLMNACAAEQINTPKPRMYPRVVFPPQAYETLMLEDCSFTFEKPAYAKVKTGIKFFGEESSHPCWFDLELDEFKGAIHFSYIPIENENSLDKLVADAFRIVEQHNTKAEYREEVLIENKNGVHGLQFNLEGPVASPINFFLTDTTSHFLRASLYFNAAVDPDSIAPILKFVSKDIEKIVETFQWKE
jgi:gliding motility-associated lipoprotein GldD